MKPLILVRSYKCFDAFSLSGLPMYMLLLCVKTQVELYKTAKLKYVGITIQAIHTHYNVR